MWGKSVTGWEFGVRGNPRLYGIVPLNSKVLKRQRVTERDTNRRKAQELKGVCVHSSLSIYWSGHACDTPAWGSRENSRKEQAEQPLHLDRARNPRVRNSCNISKLQQANRERNVFIPYTVSFIQHAISHEFFWRTRVYHGTLARHKRQTKGCSVAIQASLKVSFKRTIHFQITQLYLWTNLSNR